MPPPPSWEEHYSWDIPVAPSPLESWLLACVLEKSKIAPLRVIRLLAIMTVDGNAFDEKINKFNRSMNRGYKLSKWFSKEFGSTQCQAITHCDFSDLSGVNNYIQGNCITSCKQIAEQVAAKVQTTFSN